MPEMMKMDDLERDFSICKSCGAVKRKDSYCTCLYGRASQRADEAERRRAEGPRLTLRQEARLVEIIKEIEDRWGVHLNLHRIDKTFAEETRPGRGHDLTWVAYEEDRFFQGTVDVYGNGEYGVTERVEWACTGNEFCECEHCKAEREEDAEGFFAQVEAQER